MTLSLKLSEPAGEMKVLCVGTAGRDRGQRGARGPGRAPDGSVPGGRNQLGIPGPLWCPSPGKMMVGRDTRPRELGEVA